MPVDPDSPSVAPCRAHPPRRSALHRLRFGFAMAAVLGVGAVSAACHAAALLIMLEEGRWHLLGCGY